LVIIILLGFYISYMQGIIILGTNIDPFHTLERLED